MANKIKIKRNELQGQAPAANDLEVGEIAMNPTDQKLYTKKTDNTVVEVANVKDPIPFAIALG